MSRVDAAAPDRLPWLPDEPKAKPAKRGGRAIAGWAAGALLAVGGAAFWIGVQSVQNQPAHTAKLPAPSATVQLPAPRPSEPQVSALAQPEVRVAPAPQVRPSPVREVRIAPPPQARAAPQTSEKAASVMEKPEKAHLTPAAKPAAAFVPAKPWNPRIAVGAAGRLVQVGAFGSIRQSKRGWWYMVRAYPAMRNLPAVVRPARNSKGRIFYRFQVGTTSQAHSEILCQRMQKIGLSCAVVGLPWKARVER
jgi:hypothetical protein